MKLTEPPIIEFWLPVFSIFIGYVLFGFSIRYFDAPIELTINTGEYSLALKVKLISLSYLLPNLDSENISVNNTISSLKYNELIVSAATSSLYPVSIHEYSP